MDKYSEISGISPFPIVNLKSISPPSHGFFLKRNKICERSYHKNSLCKEHYESMFKLYVHNKFVKCPHGFTSYVFKVGGQKIAFTGFVPFPRSGGEDERNVAKLLPEVKISSESIEKAALGICNISTMYDQIGVETLQNYAMALHEIRKLNRTVKQSAERMCIAENREKPDLANRELVQIWKSADLMSSQFDIIEILANETIATLPMNSTSEIYRIFDKCVRIFQPEWEKRRIRMWAPSNYSPRIRVCDKTFPIIPTVLIENAKKYSVSDSGISISISPDPTSQLYCIVNVSNTSELKQQIDETIFERGRRISGDKDGSGNGLYVAQLIARQHDTKITVHCTPDNGNVFKCSFSVRFRVVG